MKAGKIKKIAIGIIAVLMVATSFFGVVSLPAVQAKSPAPSASVRKDDYKPPERKPTYTATLNENNKLLKQLEDRLNGQNGKKENKALSFTKMYGKDIIDGTFSLLNMIKNASSGAEADWEEIGVDLARKLIVSVAARFGFGGMADSVFNGLESLLAEGEAPLSEIEILTDDINRQFDRMSDRLYEIEDQIGALSEEVKKTTADVLSGTSSQIENLDAKQILRAFMTRGEGNFSYYRFQNYIYGSTRGTNANKAEAYYNQLREASAFGADRETIRYYNDKLFDALHADIGAFREYYFGDTAGLDKSIAKYYYDYLSANSSLIPAGKTAESTALEFAYDLYSTYVFAYEIIKVCYSYQISEMFIEESLNGNELGVNSRYRYNETDYSYYTVIMSDLDDIETYLGQAEESVVSDVAYILGMGNSYIAEDANGNLHEIAEYGNTFGNIANGQTIYLNKITDEINDIFELDADKYVYFVNGVRVTDAKEIGVIDSDEVSDRFWVTVGYGSTELYSIGFVKEATNAFSGGSGSYDDPYLISNVYQFLKIKEEMNACYELIADLQFGHATTYPIGTYQAPFNGILNGNGYTLGRLIVSSIPYDETNVTLTPTTGLFGTLGEKGIVENLTVKDVEVVSDYDKDGVFPHGDNSAYFVGTIAGYNGGRIFNCVVTGNSSVTVCRKKELRESRNVEVYVGGIAGANGNEISYCEAQSLRIEAESLSEIHAESAKRNKNSLYTAGIAAISAGRISYCRASENVTLSAYAKSTANTEDKVSPYVTVKTGGVVADENNAASLSSVYSAAQTVRCRGEVYNAGKHWLLGHRYGYGNVSIKDGAYYPTFFWVSDGDSLDEAERAVYQDKYESILYDAAANYIREHQTFAYSYDDLPPAVQKELSAQAEKLTKNYLRYIKYLMEETAVKALKENVLPAYDSPDFAVRGENYLVEIIDSSVYEVNAPLIDKKSLRFRVNGEDVKDVRILSYYGFDTFNEQSHCVTNNVKIFFISEIGGEDVLLAGNAALTVKEDEIVGDIAIDGIKTEYEINADKEIGLSAMFEKGFTVCYFYASGKADRYDIDSGNRDSVTVEGFDTSVLSDDGFVFTVIHNGNAIAVSAKVICRHLRYSHTGDVPATCQTLGYEEWTCDDCGKTVQKNYRAGDHHYVAEGGIAATCVEPGLTQSVWCDVCGTVFEESTWIRVLDHDFISIEEAKKRGFQTDDAYSASGYHYCANGRHYEAHQYVVTESSNGAGKRVYVYTCRECAYSYSETDENLITDEQGKMPVVFVTDGYVLHPGDEVTVYVQLLNNPGFNGANFGIRYSDGLRLIRTEEGGMIPSGALSVGNEVHNGYNYLLAKTNGENWTEDGYILKLVFRAIGETKEDQTVEVVYGRQKITYTNGKTEETEGGFSTTSAKYGIQKFITHSGTISFVDHLPGDVNEDDQVDIMDAMYIAWGIVGKPGISFKKQNADVNLDGKVDLYDVICILQSISGNYGTNLLSPEFRLRLNLNGFDSDDVDRLLTVYFYDEDGEVNNWNAGIPFAKYEAEMNRRGYTFVGWYNRLVGGQRVDVSGKIVYDAALGVQTLYAHWVKNLISFDGNGATDGEIEDAESDENTVLELPSPTQEYTVYYVIDGSANENYKPQIIYRRFLYWEDQLGNRYNSGEKFALYESNLLGKYLEAGCFDENGEIKIVLKAIWGDYSLQLPETDGRVGYDTIEDWYIDAYYQTGFDIEKINDLVAGGFRLYAKSKLIEYTINYGNLNGASNLNNSTKFTVANDVTLVGLENVTGYEFEGWYAGERPVKSITKDNFLSIFGENTSATLLAVWRVLPIEVKVIGIDENSYYNGSYGELPIKTLYYCYGDDKYAAGYYNESSFTNPVLKFEYRQYSNFEIRGCYEGKVVNNGHSSDNGEHSAAYDENTAFFDQDGVPVAGRIPEKDTAIYAYCCPKQFTITFRFNVPAYGDTVTAGCTESLQAYFNESIAKDNIVMPVNSLYKAEYRYQGIDYFDFDGKCDKTATMTSDVIFDAYWGEEREMEDTAYHTEKYADVYYIRDEAELIYAAKYYNAGSFALIDDIVLSSSWTPIASFSGKLDGNDKTVTLSRTANFYAAINYGIFGILDGARIFDLNVSVSVVYSAGDKRLNQDDGRIYIGGIAGIAQGDTVISGCEVTGNITQVYTTKSAFLVMGGLVGKAIGNTSISDCVNRATVYGQALYVRTGGIAGRVDDAGVSVRGCANYGYIRAGGSGTGGNGYAGSIVGAKYTSATVADCVNHNDEILASGKNNAAGTPCGNVFSDKSGSEFASGK